VTQSRDLDPTPSTVIEDTDTPRIEVNVEGPGTLALPPADQSTDQSTDQWRKIGEQASRILAELPDYVSEFFNQYQRPIVTIGLLVGALITVKVTLAILDALNDIPLLSPTFELIGIGYSTWFVYRYLLRASNRQELSEEFNSLKEQVVGNRKFPGT
jgi:hypothetical protein